MIKNQTYRLIAATFLGVLLGSVFLLQSLHPLSCQHNDEETCNIETTHIHDEENRHLSCSICLFHLSPTVLDADVMTISQPNLVSTKLVFDFDKYPFTQKRLQSYLRGPPQNSWS